MAFVYEIATGGGLLTGLIKDELTYLVTEKPLTLVAYICAACVGVWYYFAKVLGVHSTDDFVDVIVNVYAWCLQYLMDTLVSLFEKLVMLYVLFIEGLATGMLKVMTNFKIPKMHVKKVKKLHT